MNDNNNELKEKQLIAEIVQQLKEVYDPEIPVNIYDLGLIYKIEVDNNIAHITMTLTAPACPVAELFPDWVRFAVMKVKDIKDATVNITFDPPWTPEKMSEDTRFQLGLM